MQMLNLVGSIAAPSPVTHYCPQDFTATFATDTTILITGAPFSVDDSECRIVYIRYKTDTTALWNPPLVNGMDGVSIDAAADVITVSGVDPAPFATDDVYEIGIQYQTKGYSSPLDAGKFILLNPDSETYSGETVADVTNEADASSDFYVSMDGFRTCLIQYEIVGGTDVLGLTVYGTLQDDGTAAASCTYQDITQYGVDILTAATTAAVYTADCVLKTQDNSSWKYLKINVASDLSSSDGDYKIFAKRLY